MIEQRTGRIPNVTIACRLDGFIEVDAFGVPGFIAMVDRHGKPGKVSPVLGERLFHVVEHLWSNYAKGLDVDQHPQLGQPELRGEPATYGVVTTEGNVICYGPMVGTELEAVCVNAVRTRRIAAALPIAMH